MSIFNSLRDVLLRGPAQCLRGNDVTSDATRSRPSPNRGFCFALLLGLVFAFSAGAHDLPISEMTIVADTDTMHVEFMVNTAELHLESELDANGDGQLAYAELEPHGEKIARRVVDLLTFRVGEQPLEVDVCGIVPNPDTHHSTIRAHYRVDVRQDALTVESRLFAIAPSSHVTQVTFRRPGKRHVARLSSSDPEVRFPRHYPPGVRPGRPTGSSLVRQGGECEVDSH